MIYLIVVRVEHVVVGASLSLIGGNIFHLSFKGKYV